MDRNVVNLAALAVHQQGLTVAADKIDGVITRVEDRRHFDNAAHEWWGDKFQAERVWRLITCLSAYGRQRYSVSQSPGCLAQSPCQ